MKLMRCSICGKKRSEEFEQDSLLWKTDLIIVDGRYNDLEMKKKITICPECRKKPLQEIFMITQFGVIDKFNN